MRYNDSRIREDFRLQGMTQFIWVSPGLSGILKMNVIFEMVVSRPKDFPNDIIKYFLKT
jgi:hypothetical protein